MPLRWPTTGVRGGIAARTQALQIVTDALPTFPLPEDYRPHAEAAPAAPLHPGAGKRRCKSGAFRHFPSAGARCALPTPRLQDR